MVLVWVLFTAMLFVLEPLVLDRLLERQAALRPEATWRWVERLHWGLLGAGLLATAGAVAGAQGLNLFAW